MARLPLLLVLLALTAGWAGPAAAQAADVEGDADGQAGVAGGQASAEDVRELLALTGAAKLGLQVFRQSMVQMRKLVPQAPESFWQAMETRARPEALVEMMVPIYQRHLTAEDVRALIAFYRSPAGRKLVQELPGITQEGMEAGRVWGQQLAREILEGAKAQGYQIKT